MTRIFFDRELDTVATFWQVMRRDGVTLGFTTHDRDLWFDGIVHRAAPGMLPSAIRRTSGLEDDGAEVTGALSHASISAADLANGRFDGAAIAIGAVDWETREHCILYRGSVGSVSSEGAGFSAQLRSAKAALGVDPIPRTSPACRARFCDRGCTLSASRYTRRASVAAVDLDANAVRFDAIAPANFVEGELRLLGGPQIGMVFTIAGNDDGALVLEQPLREGLMVGTPALLREGCDHTIATCAARFGNAANFQGEPYLPGNDLLAQYPVPR